MSAFNPDTFLNTETDSANSSTYTPVPEGEFNAAIKAIKPRVLTDGRAILDVTWTVDDEIARNETGMAEPSVRQTLWLDTTESGGLDFGKGKNVGLGRLREAVGQNQAGKPWAPGMLVGQVAKVKVGHSIDKRDGVTINADVKAVLPL
jgi:hypothetical protein